MGRIIIKDNVFVYEETDLKKVLLDCNNLIANNSRIPMHSLDGNLTIPALILNTVKKHRDLWEEKNDALEYLLMDIILISYLIRSPLPVKVLELGCENGVLSYHLATILGKFNKESFLCCVCNVIGNNSSNRWLDRISLVDEPPELSLVAADYDKTQLAKKNFDMVVINGTIDFKEPYQLVKEAESFLKEDGVLFCYSDNQPLLESSFKLCFPNREEYSLNAGVCIMEARCQKDGMDRVNKRDEVQDYIDAVSGLAEGEIKKEEIRKMVNQIDEYIAHAIVERDLERKVNLIYQKEILVDLIVKARQEI